MSFNRKTNQGKSFWHNVDKSSDCWLWLGTKNPSGHGRYWDGSNNRFVMAYRWSWELVNGKVPEGKILHHKCKNPACVRPDHLYPMTNGDHSSMHLTRTQCKRGHELSGSNVGFFRSKNSRIGEGRYCKECQRLRRRGLV